MTFIIPTFNDETGKPNMFLLWVWDKFQGKCRIVVPPPQKIKRGEGNEYELIIGL